MDIPIRMAVTVETLTDTDNSVVIEFSDRSAGNRDLVVVCDGICSKAPSLVSSGIEEAIAFAQEIDNVEDTDPAISAWFDRRVERMQFVQQGAFVTGQHVIRDEESDEPKLFPATARAALEKNLTEIGIRLAEPI